MRRASSGSFGPNAGPIGPSRSAEYAVYAQVSVDAIASTPSTSVYRPEHRNASLAVYGADAVYRLPPSTPVYRLESRRFSPASDLAVQLNKRTSRTKNACSITRTALLVHGSAGMISAGSSRGSSHALVPWNREQAWSASGPSGGHAFSGRTDANTDEHRTANRSRVGHEIQNAHSKPKTVIGSILNYKPVR